MANKNYMKGRRFEYKVADGLRRVGNTVMRTAGSHGPFDLIAISNTAPHRVQMVQCKVVAKRATADQMMKTWFTNPPFDPMTGLEFNQCLEIWVTRERKRCWAFV